MVLNRTISEKTGFWRLFVKLGAGAVSSVVAGQGGCGRCGGWGRRGRLEEARISGGKKQFWHKCRERTRWNSKV